MKRKFFIQFAIPVKSGKVSERHSNFGMRYNHVNLSGSDFGMTCNHMNLSGSDFGMTCNHMNLYGSDFGMRYNHVNLSGSDFRMTYSHIFLFIPFWGILPGQSIEMFFTGVKDKLIASNKGMIKTQMKTN